LDRQKGGQKNGREFLLAAIFENVMLKRRRGFGDDPNLIVRNLKESPFDMEPFPADIGAKPECSLAKQGHHGGVAGQDTDFTIEGRGDDRIDVALEEHFFW
jgi:hypothetical protein